MSVLIRGSYSRHQLPISPSLGILAIGLLGAAFAWPLFVVFEFKVGYIIFAVCTGLLALRVLEAPLHALIKAYLVVVTFVALLHWVTGRAGEFFLYSLATYVAVPFLYGRRLIDATQLIGLLRWLSVMAIPNFIAVMLQTVGYESDFLVIELTRTGGEAHERLSGLMGGSLALGLFSAIAAVTSFQQILETKRGRYLAFVVFFSAIACLGYSYARRYYFVCGFGLSAVLWSFLKGTQISAMLRRALGTLLVMVTVGVLLSESALFEASRVVERVESTFDFDLDVGNVTRVEKWKGAIRVIEADPEIGIGFGSSGVVGRDPTDIWRDFEGFLTAESYYLQMAMEGGIAAGLMFVIFIGIVCYRAANGLARRFEVSLLATITLMFALESTTGTALVSPFSAAIFWLCSASVLEDAFARPMSRRAVAAQSAITD
jgi:hypothetical protein